MMIPLSSCKKKNEPYFYESNRKGVAEAPVKEVPKDILATQQAFINVVKGVTPSVVNISTVSKKKLVQPFFEMSPFFDDFFGGREQRPQYRTGKQPRLRGHHQQGRLHPHQRSRGARMPKASR